MSAGTDCMAQRCDSGQYLVRIVVRRGSGEDYLQVCFGASLRVIVQEPQLRNCDCLPRANWRRASTPHRQPRGSSGTNSLPVPNAVSTQSDLRDQKKCSRLKEIHQSKGVKDPSLYSHLVFIFVRYAMAIDFAARSFLCLAPSPTMDELKANWR